MFDEDFDTMVTPMAYDLDIALTTSDDFELARLFGVPGADGSEPSYDIDVSTAFLSNRRGALVARLDTVGEPSIAELDSVGAVSLSYLPEPALGWSAAVEQVEEIRIPAESGTDAFYAGAGARKAIALVNLGQQLQSACGRYHQGQSTAAIDMLTELVEYLSGEAEAMNDSALATEIALVEQLISNMQ